MALIGTREAGLRTVAKLPSSLPFWAPLAGGLLVMAIPTLIGMGRESWSTEAGSHGPIVLATGCWLLVHNGMRLSQARPMAPSWKLFGFGVVAAWLGYIFGRAYGFLIIEALGLYAMFICCIYRLFGFAEIRRQAFPLFYLAFAIPLPGWLIHPITAPLQTLVSWASAGLMDAAGYPIARQGVSLYIAQYQLLVEDACAGLNSLIGLIAISLFYIYLLHRESWRYALLLLAFVVPIAIVANILRVVVLMLLTYHFGDSVAQGVMHGTTGIVLFAVALGLVFGIDKLLSGSRRLAHA
ncbi:MAG: exosortase V [Novosphingobium sp.]